MNKLILCEGKTDAILLSYYLEKVAGWKYTTKSPSGLKFKISNENESMNWYRKDQDYLLICSVGGKSNFGKFFINRIKAPQVMIDAETILTNILGSRNILDYCRKHSNTRM